MKSERTRVLFLQLPLLDANNASAAANLSLAGGYLAQALAADSDDAESVFLPRELVAYGTDAAVIDALVEAKPDILALTAYMWNVERSFSLAAKAKAALPGCRVWFGGPEMQPDSSWLGREEADNFFLGEGETAIAEAFAAYRSGDFPARIMQGKPTDLGAMSSPFVSSLIAPGKLGQAAVETMRGCLCRCRYCYYGKSNPGLRLFPDSRIEDFFSWARRAGIREAYLMDPALDQRPDFEEFLLKLASWNSSRIPLHAELKAESVDRGIAVKLARAGVRSVEVGLQTVTETALRTARRGLDRERFKSGARALAGEGVEVRTGIILGLPDDSLGGFENTLAFVAEIGIQEHAEIYPLAVLPGTSYREDASSLGIEYLPVPPYTVLASRGWAEGDFQKARESVEGILGKGLYQTILPRFAEPAGPFARWTSLSGLADARTRFASSVCVLVKEEELADEVLLGAAANRFVLENPHGVAQIVIIEREGGRRRGTRPDIDDRALALSDRFFDPGHYQERCRLHDDDVQGRFSVRLFFLTRSSIEIRRLMDGEGFCEPIYRIDAGQRPDACLLSDWTPLIAGRARDFERWNGLIDDSYEGQEEMKIVLPEDYD